MIRDLRFNPDIGPTGSNYVMGSEIDFLKNASNAGYTDVYVPSALVYHQIRPEQLTHSWIYGRAFRLGRSIPYRDQSKPDLKIKKWMLREIANLFARYIYSTHLEQNPRNWRAELIFTNYAVIFISATKVAAYKHRQ